MERNERGLINYGWRVEDGDLMIVDYGNVCRSKRKGKQRRKRNGLILYGEVMMIKVMVAGDYLMAERIGGKEMGLR